MTFIYALADPETDEIRYVGKADCVKERFASHLREAKTGKVSYKCNWIRQVTGKNLTPKLIVLEEVSQEDWKKAEIYYIEEFKKFGHGLTNIAKGGEGFETGYVQDHLFSVKKFLGKRYNELKRTQDYRLLNQIATTMVAMAQANPSIVPKRWMAIQLP
jgi:hypothetical protein